ALRAQRVAVERAEAVLSSQRREAFPDLQLGLRYSRDYFTVSGDNPSSLSFNVAVPLPLFDRNQGGIGHAAVDVEAAENDRNRLELAVRHDVAAPFKRVESPGT